MSELRFRQIHLDFHTGGSIDKVGGKFSKSQFQEMLKKGKVNSVTVFAKCWHGWAYFPSTTCEIHPNLQLDLLGAQIEAAQEIGVKTPVYIGITMNEVLAKKHPEWIRRKPDESMYGTPNFTKPGFFSMCLNSPYLDVILSQVREVLSNYDADGLFLDGTDIVPCYCQTCVSTLRSEGKDPQDKKAVQALAERVFFNYANKVKEVVDQIRPSSQGSLPIFHNAGHVPKGRRDIIFTNSHLELESLPTGGWGYDHFPFSVRYVQQLGLNYLGMTGKFHTSWGEFGGFKHPNALRYEVCLNLANGAACSIGDQLHPEGIMDNATYEMIGKAYSEVEQKENWCKNVTSISDVALLSLESLDLKGDDIESHEICPSDAGALRILMEGQFLFDVIDFESDFNVYKVIVLPDFLKINEELKRKLEDYVHQGGKILATGLSGLNSRGEAFAIDFGAEFICENPYNPDYFKPNFQIKDLGEASFVMYSKGQKIKLTTGIELGYREDPYFNRDVNHFCSHKHSPSTQNNAGPGMVQGKSGVYISWNVFEDYALTGSLILRRMVSYGLDLLLGNKKTLTADLPSKAIATVMHQETERRIITHLLYASPIKRGNGIEVIDDIVPILNTEIRLNVNYPILNVYLAPQNKTLPFSFEEESGVSVSVPEINCHQMIVFEY